MTPLTGNDINGTFQPNQKISDVKSSIEQGNNIPFSSQLLSVTDESVAVKLKGLPRGYEHLNGRTGTVINSPPNSVWTVELGNGTIVDYNQTNLDIIGGAKEAKIKTRHKEIIADIDSTSKLIDQFKLETGEDDTTQACCYLCTAKGDYQEAIKMYQIVQLSEKWPHLDDEMTLDNLYACVGENSSSGEKSSSKELKFTLVTENKLKYKKEYIEGGVVWVVWEVVLIIYSVSFNILMVNTSFS